VNDRQAVVLGLGVSNGKPVVVIATNEAARTAGLQAGRLVYLACGELGGGGGGRPDLAHGGGRDHDTIPADIRAGTDAGQGRSRAPCTDAARQRGRQGAHPVSVRRGPRLGLDIGSVRIGAAASDPDGILATPLTVVRRKDEPAALKQLREIVAEYEPIELLV